MAGAISIDEFNARVNNLVANLPKEIEIINDGLALSLIPIIVGRLINKGKDGKGKSLGKYSTNPLPTFFFKHKGLGSGADAKFDALVKRKKKQEGKAFKGVSYEEFRQLNNRPTDHVTLSFTGETLADIGVTGVETSPQIVVTTIGSLATKTKAKYKSDGTKAGQNTTAQVLDYLGERYGIDLLAPTTEEEAELGVAWDQELQKLTDKYLE